MCVFLFNNDVKMMSGWRTQLKNNFRFMHESTLSARCLQSIPILPHYNSICDIKLSGKLQFDLPPCRMMTVTRDIGGNQHGYTEPSHTSDVSCFSSKCHHCHFTVVYFVVKCLMWNNWRLCSMFVATPCKWLPNLKVVCLHVVAQHICQCSYCCHC